MGLRYIARVSGAQSTSVKIGFILYHGNTCKKKERKNNIDVMIIQSFRIRLFLFFDFFSTFFFLIYLLTLIF